MRETPHRYTNKKNEFVHQKNQQRTATVVRHHGPLKAAGGCHIFDYSSEDYSSIRMFILSYFNRIAMDSSIIHGTDSEIRLTENIHAFWTKRSG